MLVFIVILMISHFDMFDVSWLITELNRVHEYTLRRFWIF